MTRHRGPLAMLWRLVLPKDPGAFRLFLAMLVFVHHFSSLDWGAFAVYVFFVLSGYWVQRMWVGRYRLTRCPYLTFGISRLWRLAPVMLLVSAVTLALLPSIGVSERLLWSNDPFHLALSSAILLGYSWLDYGPVGSAWSLDVEMQFYIAAPFLVWAAMRWGLAAIMALAALSSAIFYLLAPDLYLAPKYAIFFAAGLAAAQHGWKPGPTSAAWSGGAVLAIVALVLASPWRGILVGGADPGPLHAHAPAFNVALALIAIPYALFTVTRDSDFTDRMFADLSYIIYLLHWVAMQWFFQYAGEPFGVRLGVAACSFVLVPAFAWLIWRFYDRPLNRWRARWVGSRLRADSADRSADSEPPGP